MGKRVLGRRMDLCVTNNEHAHCTGETETCKSRDLTTNFIEQQQRNLLLILNIYGVEPRSMENARNEVVVLHPCSRTP